MWNGTRSPPSLRTFINRLIDHRHLGRNGNIEMHFKPKLRIQWCSCISGCLAIRSSCAKCTMHVCVCERASFRINHCCLLCQQVERRIERSDERRISSHTHNILPACNLCGKCMCADKQNYSLWRPAIWQRVPIRYIYIFCAGPIRHFCMQLSTSYIHTAWYFTYIDLFFVRVFGVLPHAIYCRRCLLYDYY